MGVASSLLGALVLQAPVAIDQHFDSTDPHHRIQVATTYFLCRAGLPIRALGPGGPELDDTRPLPRTRDE
jgi:hypothetical protein